MYNDYVILNSTFSIPMSQFQIFTDEEIELVREGGKILRDCLDFMGQEVGIGVTTKDLDRKAEEFIRSHNGAEPGFKGYHGFPATLCTSVNEECVHGIPGDRVLQDGDIISVDCGVRMHGFYTDACRTFPIGNISDEAQKLMAATQGALNAAEKILKAGVHVGDVSSAVQQYAESQGFTVVRSLTGHGLGKDLHQFPDIPNFGEAGTGAVFPVKTLVAIEPIIATGEYQVIQSKDGWTLSMKDKGLSAHFEHTFVVWEDKCEIIA